MSIDIPPPEETEVIAEGKPDFESLHTLELAVNGNFQESLSAVNERFGVALEPRNDICHMTILSPPEIKVLRDMSPGQADLLLRTVDGMRSGEGYTISGIGYIDGSTRNDLREVDKAKKTAFIAIVAPGLQEFRRGLGLSSKDFHITLGFEGGDIHMRTAPDDAGKTKKVPIEKNADPALAGIPIEVRFGSLGGQSKG